MSKRVAALGVMRSQIGVVEKTPNWSPQIKLYLQSTGITMPAAYCMACVHWCFKQVGVSLGGGASVGNFQEWATLNGEIVQRPFKGDVVCFDWDGDNWPDHAGMVEKVLALRWRGKTFAGWVQTIEANSAIPWEKEGVWRHRRWINNCKFCRVKG